MKTETNKESKHFLDINKFVLTEPKPKDDVTGSEQVSKAGVTGSKQVSKDGIKFQLKNTIFDAKTSRKLKAGSTDRENFGEVIAATVARSMLVDERTEEYIPDVSLVLDKENNKALIASKYIDKYIGTLDEMYDKDVRKHIKISFAEEPTNTENVKKGHLYLGGNESKNILMRQEIAQALAVSALSGDHDINPGNMIGFKGKDGETHVARIDFGHAFNDLLNAPKTFGGVVRNNKNEIIDFFNRPNVAGFPAPNTSKLWRDYESLIPSDELIDALKNVGSKDHVRGLDEARANFQALWVSADGKLRKHIENSLIAINNASGGQNIDLKSDSGIINQVFYNLRQYYTKRKTSMLQAAQLMEMQRDVDKFINGQDNVQLKDLRQQFKEYSKDNKHVEWLKTSKGSKPFQGTLEEFVVNRCRVLRNPEMLKNFKEQLSIEKNTEGKISFVDGLKKYFNNAISFLNDSFTKTSKESTTSPKMKDHHHKIPTADEMKKEAAKYTSQDTPKRNPIIYEQLPSDPASLNTNNTSVAKNEIVPEQYTKVPKFEQHHHKIPTIDEMKKEAAKYPTNQLPAQQQTMHKHHQRIPTKEEMEKYLQENKSSKGSFADRVTDDHTKSSTRTP